MVLYVDAMSVFAAITATYIKHPAEKGLLSHVQFVRELLDSGVLQVLMWIDTRDMSADGMTKGSIDRDMLHLCMEGYMKFKHEFKLWKSKVAAPTEKLIAGSKEEIEEPKAPPKNVRFAGGYSLEY